MIFSGIFAPVNSYFTVASHISLCASVLMIVALSHERYFAICSPHIYRIHMRSVSRWKHLAKYIVPVVLVSIICNIPMLINIIDREILKNPIYVKVICICTLMLVYHCHKPVFTPKMAIFRRAGMKKGGLPFPLVLQYLILMI